MTADAILNRVCRALDALIASAQPYDGFFPSMLDRATGTMLMEIPAPIPGQRPGDRAYHGSNLMHDEATLLTLYALDQALGRPDFTTAADAYLQRFATHCTETATGLFPWGEHAFWDLAEDCLGSSLHQRGFPYEGPVIHDHLRQAPLWLWNKLQQFNPRCVERFAEGLDYHWIDGTPREYIRHAPIDKQTRLQHDSHSCDFPRHSGFYLLDLAFAWRQHQRDPLLRQMHAFLDYWWEKRDEHGLLLIQSRTPESFERFYQANAPGQTLSLATSLLETAFLLDDGAAGLAATMRVRALHYIDGFFTAPHDLEHGVFSILCRCQDNALTEAMPIWGSKYGLWPASYVALTALCAYRLVGDSRLLTWAQAVGHGYLRQPFPDDVAVPAMDAGLGLGLLADLYDITGEASWLTGGLALAETLLARYCDRDLPRGAAGVDWYESQMGPGLLLHGLARIALLSEQPGACPLPSDYTAR